MAKNNNGPIIGLAIFAVLTVVFAVFWYMTYSDNQAKAAQLANAANSEQDLKGTVADLISQVNTLKQLIGRAEGEDVNDQIKTEVEKYLGDLSGDGTNAIPNLEGAIMKTASESDKHNYTATHRQFLLDQKAQQLDDTIVSKDGEILTHKEALAKAEAEKAKLEADHSEQMERLENENKSLRAEKAQIEDEYAQFRVEKDLEVEDLTRDNNQKREAIVDLRRRLFSTEDQSFSTPDGLVTNVDHNSELCYIDLGKADGLRTGVTFSVYKQKNSGVGRRTTDDIKGKIEIVDILGPHEAEARIVEQKPGSPVSSDDPIYSPIFQAGQALEIAVAGRISLDGLNRDQFRRLVTAAGAKIAVEVDDEGEFGNGKGQPLGPDEATSRISSRTRFLVIADLGDEDSTQNNDLLTIYEKIRKNTNTLKNRALNLGVYEIGLSTFLEHIGYSRKQLAWTPESQSGFPARLANGSRSSSARASFGQRQSSGAISGAYSNRRRTTTVSGGATSAAYSK